MTIKETVGWESIYGTSLNSGLKKFTSLSVPGVKSESILSLSRLTDEAGEETVGWESIWDNFKQGVQKFISLGWSLTGAKSETILRLTDEAGEEMVGKVWKLGWLLPDDAGQTYYR